MQSIFLHNPCRLSGGCWINPAAGHREDLLSPFCRYPAPTLPVVKVNRPMEYNKHLLLQAVVGYQGGICKDTKPLGSVCKFDFVSGKEKIIHCYSKISMQRQFLTTSAESYISKSSQPVALRKITSQNNKELKSELRDGIKNGAVTITQMQLCTQEGTVHYFFVKNLIFRTMKANKGFNHHLSLRVFII